MIHKVAARLTLKDASLPGKDLAYWLSKTPEERLSAVEFLKKQWYGEIQPSAVAQDEIPLSLSLMSRRTSAAILAAIPQTLGHPVLLWPPAS